MSLFNQNQKEEKGLTVKNVLNLENLFLFAPSKIKKKSREFIFKETLPNGKTVERKIIIGKITDGTEFGILNTYHQLVCLALKRIWEEQEKPIGEPFYFSLHRIVKLLKISSGVKNLERIKKLLIQLHQTPIIIRSGLTTEYLSILGRIEIYEFRKKEEDKRKKITGYVYCKFNEFFLKKSLIKSFPPLSLEVLTSFNKKNKETCIRLYIYLDRKFTFQDTFYKEITELWSELGFSQSQIRGVEDIKNKLQPVIDQLKNKPISTGIISYIGIEKIKDGGSYNLIVNKEKSDLRRCKIQ